jgi:predicted AAA+ superfamily ATPase
MVAMIERPFWLRRIDNALSARSIVWLSGVRRVGKTSLARMLEDASYLNCDLPSIGRRLADPETYYSGLEPGATVVFDEVHRLDDPSSLLKIAADEHPRLKILATGSSSLAATRKFRDSLSGRKRTVFLPPVLWSECTEIFQVRDFDRRLLHGGLPEVLLARKKDPAVYSEWLDSFYARDIQELFGVRNRSGFMRLFRLLLLQSGGLLDQGALSRESELSRPTVGAHLEALSIAHAVFPVPPFHGVGRREIVRRPKVYGFDTGFVTFVKGWESIREDDRGLLWEHLVLDELRARLDDGSIFYWRDKSGREIDFVIKRPEQEVDAIECKINPDNFNPEALKVFRSSYPKGKNYICSPLVESPCRRRHGAPTVICARPDQIFNG